MNTRSHSRNLSRSLAVMALTASMFTLGCESGHPPNQPISAGPAQPVGPAGQPAPNGVTGAVPSGPAGGDTKGAPGPAGSGAPRPGGSGAPAATSTPAGALGNVIPGPSGFPKAKTTDVIGVPGLGADGKPLPQRTNLPGETIEKAEVGRTSNGLDFYILRAGKGAVPKAGQTAVVHYTGWLLGNGYPKFDSSVDKGTPFEFSVGAKQVIPGWDEAVALMKVGEKRKIIVPPSLGYGLKGAGDKIPPGSTLVFDIELLSLK